MGVGRRALNDEGARAGREAPDTPRAAERNVQQLCRGGAARAPHARFDEVRESGRPEAEAGDGHLASRCQPRLKPDPIARRRTEHNRPTGEVSGNVVGCDASAGAIQSNLGPYSSEGRRRRDHVIGKEQHLQVVADGGVCSAADDLMAQVSAQAKPNRHMHAVHPTGQRRGDHPSATAGEAPPIRIKA